MKLKWVKATDDVVDVINRWMFLTSGQAEQLLNALERLGGELPTTKCPMCGICKAEAESHQRIIEALITSTDDAAR